MATKKAAAKRISAKQASAKQTTAKKTTAKKTPSKRAEKSPEKKAISKKAPEDKAEAKGAKKANAEKPVSRKAISRKAISSKAPNRKAAGKKAPGKKAPSKRKDSAAAKPPSKRAGGLPKEGKDPRGGLTAAGRKFYNKQTGGHLKPGVKGAADTPEKKKRKGSFLTRHFTTPPGPVVKNGQPTRQALQAAAWGEPVPTTESDEKQLAAKGRKLLEESKESK